MLHKTSAWPLALVYVGLVVYASLYPFADWRYQGIVPWAFLSGPWPKYWTVFDVVSNVLGYVPVGFLLTLSALRSGRTRNAVGLATMVAFVLSLTMESLQSYLPARIPSNVDLGLNVLGAWLVETYRSDFAQQINVKGIDGLIVTLTDRNKANAKKG